MQQKLLIVCEGQTEKIYLAAWAAACNVRHRLTILTPSPNDPFGLLREGVKEYLWANTSGEDSYSDVWVVFDRDGHATFHDAIREAKKYPFVHMCWTNPCIEAWFLMHFRKLPNFPRQKEMLLTSVDTPIGNSTTLIRREEVWEKIVDPQLVLTTLKSQWSKYCKTNTDLFDHLKGKMDFALTQCVGTCLREDFQKFGSLMPEVLFAIARLGTESDEAAEKKLGTAWHALCCQKRAEARLSAYVAG